MVVAFPVPKIVGQAQLTRSPAVQEADYPAEPWFGYRAGHQDYNIWSYDADTGDVRFPDYVPESEILNIPPSGSNWGFSLSRYYTHDYITTTNKTHDFSAELGGGYETPKFAEVTGFKAKVRLSVKGSYKTGDLKTETQQVSNATDISGWVGNMGDRSFLIRTLGYFARDKSLILDYQTEMPAANWNDVYNSPDPAFILPWAGFPYGTYPELPKPGLEQMSPEVQVWPPLVSLGQTVNISATVRNFSNIPASDVRVRFCRGNPACGPSDTQDYIGEQVILTLNRKTTGPKTVAVTWQASGRGEQKIYAIIDPLNQINPEVHDEDDPINNNIAYGVLRIGVLTMVDQGLAYKTPYVGFVYQQAGGATIAAYVPPGNMPEVVDFALQDAAVQTSVSTTGKPFELIPYRGEGFGGDPEYGFALKPREADPPAVISLSQAGANLDRLKLYRALNSGERVGRRQRAPTTKSRGSRRKGQSWSRCARRASLFLQPSRPVPQCAPTCRC